VSDDIDELPTDEFAPVRKLPVEVEARRVEKTTRIETREGEVVAYEGDVLMRGVEGELYPCDPEIFAETYELVEE
jgi:hypothetical protein